DRPRSISEHSTDCWNKSRPSWWLADQTQTTRASSRQRAASGVSPHFTFKGLMTSIPLGLPAWKWWGSLRALRHLTPRSRRLRPHSSESVARGLRSLGLRRRIDEHRGRGERCSGSAEVQGSLVAKAPCDGVFRGDRRGLDARLDGSRSVG